MGTSIIDIVKSQLTALQPCLILLAALVVVVSVVGAVVIKKGTWNSDLFLYYGLLQSISANETLCIATIVFRWALVVSCVVTMVDLNSLLLPLVLVACIALGVLRKRPILFVKDVLLCVVLYAMLVLIMLFKAYIASTVINSFLWVILVLFIVLEVLFATYCALLALKWTFELRGEKPESQPVEKKGLRTRLKGRKAPVEAEGEKEAAEPEPAGALG